jgi:hypothetical protein
MAQMDERIRRLVRLGVQEARAERRRRRERAREWEERKASLTAKMDAFIDSLRQGGNGHH